MKKSYEFGFKYLDMQLLYFFVSHSACDKDMCEHLTKVMRKKGFKGNALDVQDRLMALALFFGSVIDDEDDDDSEIPLS